MIWISLALAGEADDLAARVATTCGDPYTMAELRFTFVVEVDGVEQVRRTHDWRPREGTVTVTDGDSSVHLEQLHPYIASEAPQQDAIVAYKAFINDSYWLLAPCKVLDDGVNRSIEDGRLVLTFEEVGLTPGDRYLLRVDENAHISAWEYTLEGGKVGAWTWDAPSRHGPLMLSTRRESAEGAVIRFEDVTAR